MKLSLAYLKLIVLIGIILSIFFFFFFYRTNEPLLIQFTFAAAILFLILLSFYNIYYNSTLIRNIQTLLTSTITTLFIAEIILRIALPYLPISVMNYYTPKNIINEQEKMVEYLQENPYVKFYPNRLIRSQGFRGNEYVYEWITDSQGFKNPPDMLNEEIFAVAIGDSFTEGMGLNIEDTWPSMLTNLGYITYNLGVQGYAPSQFLGAFKRYGKNLKPKLVIIGHFPGAYVREKVLMDENLLDEKIFTGGIQDINEHDKKIFNQYRLVVSALIRVGSERVANFLSSIRESMTGLLRAALRQKDSTVNIKTDRVTYYVDNHAENMGKIKGYLENFIPEFEVLDRSPISTRKNFQEDPYWPKALNSYNKIIEHASDIGAKVLLVIMPMGPAYTYYESATGVRPRQDFRLFVDVTLLKEFAEANGVDYIDTTPLLVEQAKEITTDLHTNKHLFVRDGHLNARGNSIIAQEIKRWIDANMETY